MRFAIAAIVVVAAASRGWAQPSPESIALAGPDPVFQAALADALAPASMSVISAGDVTAPSLGALSTASRELADRLHATATVWLIAGTSGATLVTYDRERDRLLVRELPYPIPLTAAQAAEAARTARTMLRALRVTPDVDQPPPSAVDAPAIRETNTPMRLAPTVLSASVLFGARLGAPDADIGGAVAAIWRPDSLGLVISGELGPSTDIGVPSFHGTVLDAATAVMARAPLHVSDKIRVAAMAGFAIHVVRLHGALEVGTPIRSTHLDPAARIGVAVTYTLSHNLDVGVAISADCLLDRQSYETGSDQVLVVPRLQTLAGAIATLRVL